MNNRHLIATAMILVAICWGIPCFGQPPASPDTASRISSPSTGPAPTSGEKKFAPLGAPKTASAAKLGKPKFALKTTAGGGAGGEAKDRAAEVKRLIDAYDNIAIRYSDRMVLAATPEEIAEAKRHEPSARALRPIARLIAEVVAADPSDESALDGLLFLSKYVGVPIIDETLTKTVLEDGTNGVDVNALVLKHHADNPKVAKLLGSWAISPETDQFLLALFRQTHCPEVRAAAGIRLVNSLQRSDRTDYAEQLAEAMAGDRYLDGVPISSRPTGPTAREWAEGKLREIRLVSVGKVIPEVTGEKLGGGVERISDYRGKVVVLDVWATWCGPCVAMIPHQKRMVDRFQGAPFAVLSVSCDAEQQTLEEFLDTQEMPWDHWWVGSDSELQKSLNINAYPTVIVLDAGGVIRHKNIKGEELEAAVQALIEEAKKAG